MTRPKPKVNQVVTYVGANRRPRPATIVAVAGTDPGPYTVDLRLGRWDTDLNTDGVQVPTITGVSERTHAAAHETNVWYRWA